jgi:hypothetical protein
MICVSTIAGEQHTSATSELVTLLVSMVPWLVLDVMPQYKRMWWIHGGRLVVDALCGGETACRQM